MGFDSRLLPLSWLLRKTRKVNTMFSPAADKNALHKLILTVIAVIGAILLGKFGSEVDLKLLAVVITFFLAMSLAFTRGTDALYFLVFAMLFSPEIGPGAGVGEGKGGMVLRLEDIILLAVAMGWTLRSAYTGRHFGIIKTPVNSAIWIYMAISIIATLLGILLGSVRSLFAGIMHNLKYFEYFLLFFMILAHVRKKEFVAHMIKAMFIVFFIVMIYGYTQIGHGQRICAPFDAEPNTFGGYIVLIMCLAGGIALTDERIRVRAIMIGLILFAIPPLLFTLSRASYLAFMVGLFSFLTVSRQRILIGATAVAIIAVMILGLPLFPDPVRERIAGTFEKETQYHVKIGNVDFDSSSSARILSYKEAIKRWVKNPVFGYGVTGTHFIDGQYPRLLAETGIAGLLAFLYVFWRLIKEVRKSCQLTQTPFLKGASMGFLCGIIAMLAHGISANSFIIVRIAEPFWLLAGLILLIPHIENQDTADSLAENQS